MKADRDRRKAIRTLALCLITIMFTFNRSYADDFKPVFNPTLHISRLNSEIKIDGRLDDSGWVHASRISNFVERFPGENLKPDVATDVFITYDDNHLYVAFKCYDDPASIRATMSQRDQFDNDDAVGLLLDTYGNAAWAYELFANPYGVQKDRLWSNTIDEDPGFDIVWESAGVITDSGYQVEMAVPFASLRFPSKDAQTWKIDFWRVHPRKNLKQYSWAAYNNNDQCWVCQWGTVTGIEQVHPGKGLEILPSVIVNQSGSVSAPGLPDSPFKNSDPKAEGSLGGKYSVNSDIAVEAAYNPDFSQIETDAAQIDVNSTIALLYPERRPFFQEGSDIFRTLFNSFYTRTVNDPQFAAKLTARKDRYSLGFVSAYDENTPYMIPLEEQSIVVNPGKSTVNALRGARTLGKDNILGFIVTDRRFNGDGYGTILSADADIKLNDTYSIIGQYIYSFTKEPVNSAAGEGLENITFDQGRYTAVLDGESYSGDGSIAQLRRRARHWNFTLNFDHTSPRYRTETGYDPWNNYRNLNAY